MKYFLCLSVICATIALIVCIPFENIQKNQEHSQYPVDNCDGNVTVNVTLTHQISILL